MNQLEPIQVTRQDLYEQIWSMPVSRACRIYGLSDVGLAKICAEWDIPRPPRGYWAKKQHGQSVRQKKLPPIEQGNPVIFTYWTSGNPEPEIEPEPQPTQSDLQRDFEKLPENHIAVPEQLADPHPLVARTEKSIRSAQPNEFGIARPKARKCLDLAVSPALIDRSLRILDALLKALEARGLTVSVADTDFPRTEVSVLEENIGFQLYEEKVRQERLPTKHEIEWELRFSPERKFYETVPSGKLVLQITDGSGLRRCWTDRSDRRVEQFLNSFVLGVFRAAESLKQARDEAERRWRDGQEREARRQEEEQRRQKEREEQDRIRREEERRQREEEARMQKLDAEVTGWVKAKQIRAYVTAVRSAHESAGGIASGSELDDWLKWATGRADELDPLTQLSGR